MRDTDLIERGIPYFPNANQVRANYRDADNSKTDAKHFVMWSGGCDSTLLLYEVLETYGIENVVAVSYNYPWLLKNKRESERIHREAFKRKMATRNSSWATTDINHLEFDISMNTISGKMQDIYGAGLPQAVAWLLSVPICARENSYIYTGAIKSDDLTLQLSSYHEMFTGIANTLNRKIFLREPFLYMTKANVIEKLIRYGIFDSTWHCEMPKDINTPCYECVPCRTHVAALTELSLGNSNDIVTITAKLELDKIQKAKQAQLDSPATIVSTDSETKL